MWEDVRRRRFPDGVQVEFDLAGGSIALPLITDRTRVHKTAEDLLSRLPEMLNRLTPG